MKLINYCKNKCKNVNLETKVSYIKSFSNETILEIIPSKSPTIVFIETLKTDFNSLIYNFGGFLSLWFGLSPIKAIDLFIEFIQLFKNNFYRIKSLLKMIVHILYKFIQLFKNNFIELKVHLK